MIDESTRTYLRSKLPEYLRAHGIDPNRSFTCLNPQHRDLGQSMHYNPQTQTLDCPLCQTRYDIFDLVCLEHNLPSLAAAVNFLYDQYFGSGQAPEAVPPSAPVGSSHSESMVPPQSAPMTPPQNTSTRSIRALDLDLDNINGLSDDLFAGVTTVAPSDVPSSSGPRVLPQAQSGLDLGIETVPAFPNNGMGISSVPAPAPQTQPTPAPMGGFDPFSPVQSTRTPPQAAPKKAPLGDVRVMGPMSGGPLSSGPMNGGTQGLPMGQPRKTLPIGSGRNDPFSDPEFIKAQQVKPSFIEPIATPTSTSSAPHYVRPGVAPEEGRHGKLNPPNVRDIDHIELSAEEIERRTAEIWGKPNEQAAAPEPEPQSYTIPKNSPYVGAGVQAKALDPAKRQAQEADATRPEVEMPLRNPGAPSTLINGKAFDFEKKSAAEVQSGIRAVMSHNPPVPQRDHADVVHTAITASTPQAAAALNPLRATANSNGPSTLVQRSAPIAPAPAAEASNPYAKAFAALNATNDNATRISGYSSALHGNQPAQAPTVNTMISSEPIAPASNAPKSSVFSAQTPGTTVFGLDSNRHTSTLMSDNRGRVLTDDFGHRVHEAELNAAKVAAARTATFDFLHPNKVAAVEPSATATDTVATSTAAVGTATVGAVATSAVATSTAATNAVAAEALDSSIILGATVATEAPAATAAPAAVPASVQQDIKALNQAANAIFSALAVPETSAQSSSTPNTAASAPQAPSMQPTTPQAAASQVAPEPSAQAAPAPSAQATPAPSTQAASEPSAQPAPQPVPTSQPTVVTMPQSALDAAAQPSTSQPTPPNVVATPQPTTATSQAASAEPKKVKPEFFAAEETETKILEVNPLEERPHSSAPELAPLTSDLDLPDVAKLEGVESDFEDDLESTDNPLARAVHKDPGFTLSEDDLELESVPKPVDAFSTLTATANALHPQGMEQAHAPATPATIQDPRTNTAAPVPSAAAQVSAPVTSVPTPALSTPTSPVTSVVSASPAVHGGDVVLVPQATPVLPTQLRGPLSHYLQRCKDAVGSCGYFAAQGFSAALIERYSLGFDPSYRVESTFTPGVMESWQPQLWQAAIIPLNEDSYVALDINSVDPLHPDKRYVGQERCFNLNVLSEGTGPILVCASELDALALLSLNVRAVALGAPQHAGLLLATLLTTDLSSSHLYLSLPQEPGWNEVRDFMLRELTGRQIAVNALDLTYPYGSIAQALSQDPMSLNNKLAHLPQISDVTLQAALTPQTLAPNHLVLNLETLARLELSPMMYAISSPAVALSRLVLASLIENKHNAILYAGSKMQWQMICSLLTFNLAQYGSMAGYQARLLELPVEQSAAMLEATLNHGLVAARLSGMAPTLMVDTFAFDHSMCAQLSPRLAQLATEFQVPVVVWCSFEQQSIFEGNALQTLAINQGNDNELIFTTLDSSCRLHSFSTKQG